MLSKFSVYFGKMKRCIPKFSKFRGLSTNSYSAMERVQHLLDKNSFEEYLSHENEEDGVIGGLGSINGKPVHVFSQDRNFYGGSISLENASRICNVIDTAVEQSTPVVGIFDGGGARIQEGSDALFAVGNIFQSVNRASGKIPQIALICGSCAGGAVFTPALMDFTIMKSSASHMFLTGPKVVEIITGEKSTSEELGGSRLHSEVSGVCSLEIEDEDRMFEKTKELISLMEDRFVLESETDEQTMMTGLEFTGEELSYDMNSVLEYVLDNGSFLPLKPNYSKNVISGLGRLGGYTVSILANQPLEEPKGLEINSLKKIEEMICFSDRFHIPLISFMDTPGFQFGTETESKGIIQYGTNVLRAYMNSTIPKMTVITRNGFGGAYFMMGCSELGGNLNFAWPNSQIGVMQGEFAAELMGEKIPGEDLESRTKFFDQNYNDSEHALERGYLEAIISPDETRDILIRNLKRIHSK